MLNWLQRWWWRRQREIDLKILWPQCKQMAPTLRAAHHAFMTHAVNEPAWVKCHGDELWKVIQELT